MGTAPDTDGPIPASAPPPSTVVLGDGETATIRPVLPTDAEGLAAFHLRQSPESVYRRYFSPKPELSTRDLEHFTRIDHVDRVALIAESHGEFLGWASYERWPGRDDADTAFMVDDRAQGKGIATLLLEHLAAIGAGHGIKRFTAEVLADNRPMLTVFSRAGWALERRYDSGVIEVDFAIAETDEYLDSLGRREQRADSRAMSRLLMPRTIAVVGASDRQDTVGAALWRNTTAVALGPVYAVNPKRSSITNADGSTVDVFARVADIPDDIGLAIVAVPAAALAAALADCAAARVRGAVITTAVDNTGVDVGTLVADANRAGIRVIGPSSMGVASSRPEIGLGASLVPVRLPPGPIALSLQSGTLGSSMLTRLHELQMGLSWFVSLGDRSDVSGNDLLQFWDDDEATTVIGMYTETLGNPRRFARIARRVSRRRPIVVVRTGAAAIGPLGGALYQQCGLIEVPSVHALLDTLRLFATQPVLRGRRVAVLSNSRSPQTLAEAALIAAGLVPTVGPVAIDWRASVDDFVVAIDAAIADPGIDGLMVIHAPPLRSDIGGPSEALDAALRGSPKPVTAVLLGAVDGPLQPGSSVPAFSFPEPAAAVLGRSYAYGHWLDTEAAATAEILSDVDPGRVDANTAAAFADRRTVLDAAETAAVLDAYGIAMPPTRYVPAAAAVEAANDVGYPVAIKARHRHVGRSVEAGVALDLADDADVATSIGRMSAALGDHADHVLVQAMTAPGVDVRIRVETDPSIGPLVTIGLGGSQADLIGDDTPRLAPLSAESATALLAESRAGLALRRAGVGSGFVLDTLLRAAQLAAEHAEITMLDLNPVIATATGCTVTDAVIRVAKERRTPATMRRL